MSDSVFSLFSAANTKAVALWVGVLWVLAFLFSLSLITSDQLLWRLFCVGGLLAIFTTVFSYGLGGQVTGLRTPKGAVSVCFFLFWLLAGTSIFWSAAPSISFMAFASFSLLPLGFLIFIMMPDNLLTYVMRYASVGCAVVGALLALWVAIQYFFLPQTYVFGLLYHPFANSNGFAALFALMLFPALGFMVTEKKSRNRNWALVVAIFYLDALVILASRGVFLALILCFVMFCLVARDVLWLEKTRFAVLGANAGVMLLLTSIFDTGRENPAGRLGGILGETFQTGIAHRIDIWQATLSMISDHPLGGTGIGTFFLYYPAYRLPEETSSGGYMVHNDPLQFMQEMGMLAPILFYLACFAVLLGMIRYWKMTKNTGEDLSERIKQMAVFCALSSVVLHSHISFNFYNGPVMLLFGALLAVFYRRQQQVLNPDKVQVWRVENAGLRHTVLGLCLMASLAFIFPLQGLIRAQAMSQKAQNAMIKGDMQRFAALVNGAERAGFGWNSAPYVLAASIPLGILEANGQTLPEKERGDLTAQATGLLDRAEKANPRLPTIYHYRGMLAAITGKDAEEQVEKAFMKALALDPTYLPAREALVRFYLDHGFKDKAQEQIGEALRYEYVRHNPLPFYNLAASFLMQEGAVSNIKALLLKIQHEEERQLKRKSMAGQGQQAAALWAFP